MPDWIDAVKLTWFGVGALLGWATGFVWIVLLRIIGERRDRAVMVRHLREIDQRAAELRRQGRS